MAGCGEKMRPNRSDVHLSSEEEAKIEEETREHFDEIAPKRHTKPQRSEYSTQYADALPANSNSADFIPEYAEFRRLESDPQKIMSRARGEAMEEFVETEYYNDLNSIGKEHHTTGTGFIKTDNANGKCFCLEPDSVTCCHASCKGNPATNDWIPAANDTAAFASDKPSRSDN